VLIGNLILFILALLLNNLSRYRHYPDLWWWSIYICGSDANFAWWSCLQK
jgi:hypothetical protein